MALGTFFFFFCMVQAFPVLQRVLCDVAIVGPSAPLGNALVGMIIWGCAVLGIRAVDGKFKTGLGQS